MTRKFVFFLAALSILVSTQNASADPERDDSKLTGDWYGKRTKLSDAGVDFAFIYKFEYNETLSGGVKRGAKTLGNFDARASVDLQKLAGMKGASFFIYGLYDHGGDPTENIGDNQVTSNIQTSVDTFRLYEAWFQQLFFEDKVSVLVGLHDLNSEFYVTETSSLFFNSSFGVGRDLSQTGRNGPSIFPVTAPSVRIRTEPTKAFYLQSALFNGVAGNPDYPQGTHVRLSSDDGVLSITEAAYLRGREENSSTLSGKYGIGIWNYSLPADDLNGNKNTNSGYYFLADQALTPKLGAFTRVGFAKAEVNNVAVSIGTGAVYKGVIPSRSEDKLGLAAAQVQFSEAYRRQQAAAGNAIVSHETAIELNYRAEFKRGFVIQPDYQYVMNPSGSSTVPNASVFATRLEINF